MKQALNAGIEQLEANIKPRIQPVLDSVGRISYDLLEAEYADNEVNKSWLQLDRDARALVSLFSIDTELLTSLHFLLKWQPV